MKPLVSSRNKASIDFVSACRQLIAHYPVEGWWPAKSRFEVMVGAILVQNTRWPNVEKAIVQLAAHHYLDPAALTQIDQEQLQGLIRPAGCQSVKARRLQAMATWLHDTGGVKALESMATNQLRANLLKVHGIGEETADAILCFAFSRPGFIADQYARTWLQRMGYINEVESRRYRPCQGWAEQQLAVASIDPKDLHAAIVLHAQTVCRPTPDCHDCLLQQACSFNRKND